MRLNTDNRLTARVFVRVSARVCVCVCVCVCVYRLYIYILYIYNTGYIFENIFIAFNIFQIIQI